MVAALNLARRSNRLAYTFLRELHERWCHFVERLHYVRLTLDYGQEHWQRVHAGGVALPAGMVQLDSQLGAVAVYALDKLAHRLDVIIVAHGQLREGTGGVHIVHAADAGNNQAHTALGALFVVIHQHLGRLAVRLTEAELRGRHYRAVLKLHRADFHRGKQHLVFHYSFSSLTSSTAALSSAAAKSGFSSSGRPYLPASSSERFITSSNP